MTSSHFRAAWLGALLSTAVLAACGGNDVVGPPDGTACTVGSIAPGDSVKGELTSMSCATFSDYENSSIWAQSWTLHAKQGTAYVVRLRHVQDAAATDNINADLYAYSRNIQGDPVLATGWWNSFGATNGNGGANEEMYLVGDKDRDYSIRVQIYALADTGAYTLSVVSCPTHALTPGTPLTGVDLSASSCSSNALFDGATIRTMTFFGFQGDSLHTIHVTDTITAGTATMYGVVTGPDMDVGCYTEFCTYAPSSNGVTAFDLVPSVEGAGLQTLMVGINADSSATATVGVTSVALPAPHPASSTRRRPAGARNR